MKSAASLVVALILLTAFSDDVAGKQAAASWRDPSPHEVRRVTVASSARLEVLDWGGSGQPLVLLGCYLTAHAYDEIAPKLTNQFHVYGITRRGIGASDRPATGYTVQRSADDVFEVLDFLNVRRSLLVGNSCAGQILTNARWTLAHGCVLPPNGLCRAAACLGRQGNATTITNCHAVNLPII